MFLTVVGLLNLVLLYIRWWHFILQHTSRSLFSTDVLYNCIIAVTVKSRIPGVLKNLFYPRDPTESRKSAHNEVMHCYVTSHMGRSGTRHHNPRVEMRSESTRCTSSQMQLWGRKKFWRLNTGKLSKQQCIWVQACSQSTSRVINSASKGYLRAGARFEASITNDEKKLIADVFLCAFFLAEMLG